MPKKLKAYITFEHEDLGEISTTQYGDKFTFGDHVVITNSPAPASVEARTAYIESELLHLGYPIDLGSLIDVQ